jgi:D-alanyl-D-alanine-carboxypeptidase/D-alanyl-D-alanine-endopeptidase
MAGALVQTFAQGWADHPFPVAAATVEAEEISTAGATDLLFEIGSITKTMTATLLARRVLAGEVTLDDPIGTWLDAGPNGDITLGQLATHTSGLPRLSPTWQDGDGFDMADPYAAFTPALAELGLQRAELTEVGTEAYSNFGFQLLGVALERMSGLSFGELARRDLFEPLGMATARVTGTEGPQAQGFSGGEPVPHWHHQILGLGGIEATAADLAAYGRAVLSPPPGPLGDAIRHVTHADYPLGWVVSAGGLVWHNGGTGGFHSILAVDRASGRAAAVLVGCDGLDEIETAAALALRGDDPTSVRPEPVGPEWSAVALELVDVLFEERWDDFRARMTPSTREALTVERLAGAWQQVMGGRGTRTATSVRKAARRAGMVTVEIDLAFADAGGDVELTFTDDHAVAGILIH